MKERVKLKRGLSDISPLFAKTSLRPQHLAIHQPEVATKMPSCLSSPEIIFSWSADDEGDAHFLNNYFASKLVSPHSPGLLISVGGDSKSTKKGAKSEAWSRSLRKLSLPVAQLDQAFSMEHSMTSNDETSSVGEHIFLEMNMNTLLRYPDLIKSLDRVVLFLHPHIESITEAYRKLKKLVAQGLTSEIAIVFDAEDAAGLSAHVYELFSDFVSKRLSLNTNYLGILHLSRGGEGLSQDLRWDSWNYDVRFRSVSVEKLRFLSWIEKTQEAEVCH